LRGGERFWFYPAGDGEDATTGAHRWFLHTSPATENSR